jgi:hypothetical protein
MGWKKGQSGNPAGCPKGIKRKQTILRDDLVQAILAEKGRRDDVLDPEGEVGGYLGSLSPKDFKDLLKSIIPKNIELDTGAGLAVALSALTAKASKALSASREADSEAGGCPESDDQGSSGTEVCQCTGHHAVDAHMDSATCMQCGKFVPGIKATRNVPGLRMVDSGGTEAPSK